LEDCEEGMAVLARQLVSLARPGRSEVSGVGDG
jgi:hypothetical protein